MHGIRSHNAHQRGDEDTVEVVKTILQKKCGINDTFTLALGVDFDLSQVRRPGVIKVRRNLMVCVVDGYA